MIGKCLNCEVQFSYSPSQKRGKYCSNLCQMEWQRKNVIFPLIEKGECSNVSSLKNYLILKRGVFCEICKNPAFHNGKSLVLELHHIDENSDNNLPENLQMLCPNCHSQIPYSVKKKNTKRNLLGQKRKI